MDCNPGDESLCMIEESLKTVFNNALLQKKKIMHRYKMSNVLTIVGNFPIKGVLNCAKKMGKMGQNLIMLGI